MTFLVFQFIWYFKLIVIRSWGHNRVSMVASNNFIIRTLALGLEDLSLEKILALSIDSIPWILLKRTHGSFATNK